MSMVYLDSLRNNIRRRTETDYIMPLWLPFIPLILNWITVYCYRTSITPFIMAPFVIEPFTILPFDPIICVGINDLLVLAVICYSYIPNIHVLYKWINPLVLLVAIICAFINLYVLYKWIKRRNEHFKRQLMMYRDIMSLLREISRERGIDISTPVSYTHLTLPTNREV